VTKVVEVDVLGADFLPGRTPDPSKPVSADRPTIRQVEYEPLLALTVLRQVRGQAT